jgi:hypothetical protein
VLPVKLLLEVFCKSDTKPSSTAAIVVIAAVFAVDSDFSPYIPLNSEFSTTSLLKEYCNSEKSGKSSNLSA